MKLLLDENLPHRLRQFLAMHEVSTVDYMGWKTIRNGRLLDLAVSHGFDVLITVDKSIPYQQHIASRSIAVIVLHAQRSSLNALRPLIQPMMSTLDFIRPSTVVHLGEV